MEWDVIQGLIDGRLLIVLAACWVIGYVLKLTPKVPDWTIIFGVTAAAIVFAILILGVSVESVVQGILVGAVAVYGNQLVKQTRKGVDEDAAA
ncbi:phage holin family protein [Paenibacillus sp. FSL W8-0426]|uniref:phage holin family protein n=1 Tax=Paenibacillus sp. FSL W8-0426 TaxID=2921714 RepID=UPI0030DA3383